MTGIWDFKFAVLSLTLTALVEIGSARTAGGHGHQWPETDNYLKPECESHERHESCKTSTTMKPTPRPTVTPSPPPTSQSEPTTTTGPEPETTSQPDDPTATAPGETNTETTPTTPGDVDTEPTTEGTTEGTTTISPGEPETEATTSEPEQTTVATTEETNPPLPTTPPEEQQSTTFAPTGTESTVTTALTEAPTTSLTEAPAPETTESTATTPQGCPTPPTLPPDTLDRSYLWVPGLPTKIPGNCYMIYAGLSIKQRNLYVARVKVGDEWEPVSVHYYGPTNSQYYYGVHNNTVIVGTGPIEWLCSKYGITWTRVADYSPEIMKPLKAIVVGIDADGNPKHGCISHNFYDDKYPSAFGMVQGDGCLFPIDNTTLVNTATLTSMYLTKELLCSTG